MEPLFWSATKRGLAAVLLGLPAVGCAPSGLGFEGPPPELVGSGAVLGFLGGAASEHITIFTPDQSSEGELALNLVVPEGDQLELVLFVYECGALERLGIEVLHEPATAAGVPDSGDDLYPRVALARRGLALRAPDRVLFAAGGHDAPVPWRSVGWRELPTKLKASIGARLPPARLPETPFVEAPSCERYRFAPLDEVVVESEAHPAFAVPSDERHALVGLGGGEVFEVRDDGAVRLLFTDRPGSLQDAHVDEAGRLWVVRTASSRRRTLESVSLDALRAGRASLEEIVDLPPVDPSIELDRGSREISIAGSRPGAPFELFFRGGDGLFARYDGQVLTSTSTRDGGDSVREAPVVWRAPGVAWTVAQNRPGLLAYSEARGFGALELLPLPDERVTALLDVPGLGVVVGDREFNLGLYSDDVGFAYLPGSEAFVSLVEDRVEALLEVPRGFIATGDRDRFPRYYRHDLEDARVETFCVVNELLVDGSEVALRHMKEAAFAGESLIMVPYDFRGRRFASSIGYPQGSACEPAIEPVPR